MPYVSGGASVVPSSLAGFEIGYDQITSAVNIASGTEATGTTIISCAAHTFDGAPVLAHFYGLVSVANADDIIISLFEGATQITRLAFVSTQTATSGTLFTVVSSFFRFTPGAGTHTYTVTAIHGSAGGTVTAGAAGTGANAPAFMRFTKV